MASQFTRLLQQAYAAKIGIIAGHPKGASALIAGLRWAAKQEPLFAEAFRFIPRPGHPNEALILKRPPCPATPEAPAEGSTSGSTSKTSPISELSLPVASR